MINVVQLGRQRVCFANIRLKIRGFDESIPHPTWRTRWREKAMERADANRYSCSQLLQILQPQVCGYRISNRARISTGCKHQPELFVNFSPPIRYPMSEMVDGASHLESWSERNPPPRGKWTNLRTIQTANDQNDL